MACVVENLRGYRVAWVRVDTQTILSIHHNVITQNPRISISYNDHRSWYLHIKTVQEVDRGWYMCQINTDPMRSRKGYLQVVVPPSIVDRETSSDMVVLESSNVSMACKATGYPEPFIMWRREDGQDIRYNGDFVNVVDGEILFITKVSRLHMGIYLCIASNGVPPSISKRISLKVQFPPMLSIPNQLEGAFVGQDVTLECRTEAFPTSINYWTTERGDMIISGNGPTLIRRVDKLDFGSYRCVAKNSLGETDGVIKLEEIPVPTTLRTTSNPDISDHRKAIKVINNNIRVDTKGPGSGFVWVETQSAVFYSCYFSPNAELDVFQSELSELRVVVPAKGKESILCGDFKSTSAVWGMQLTFVPEYDYDSVGGEYTLPSNGPPPIREPPGASSGSSISPNSFLLSVIVYVSTLLSISR
nr:unnamed protein product [Callosobruchus analis]